MTRALLMSTTAAVFGLSGALAPAVAQTFSPPLGSPAELTGPISFKLVAGTSSSCTDTQSIEGVAVPAPPASSYRLVVEEADDGLRVRLISNQNGPVEIALLVPEAGEPRLENASFANGATEQEQRILETVVTQLPELRLHNRTLNKGDDIYVTDELEDILGQTFVAMGGQTEKPDIEGGLLLVGESVSGGHRVAVFQGSISLSAPEDGYKFTQDVTEAYDVETGLRLYSDIVARMPAPEGVDIEEIVFKLSTRCSIDRG